MFNTSIHKVVFLDKMKRFSLKENGVSMLAISAQTQVRYYPPDRSMAALFYGWIRREVSARSTVLDLGAGGGVDPTRNLKPYIAKVCAVDVDPIVLKNPCAHEAKLLKPDLTIDYPDGFFDAAVSDFVFEHLSDPVVVLKEVYRVLKPGGKYFFRTLNRWHYLCLVSRCLPRGVSAFLAHRLGHEPAGAERTHETFYRLNSHHQIARHAAAAGLRVGCIRSRENHPVYFRRVPPAWYLGVMLERVLNRFPVFAGWRINLYGYLEKPCAG